MAHREFRDAGGARWDVWEVNPSRVQRELEQVRRLQSAAPDQSARRDHQALVASALSSGWLCFESGERKRRLAPIPPGWETLPDVALAHLCETAATAVRTRRSGPSTESDETAVPSPH